jgi:hypothetical protein
VNGGNIYELLLECGFVLKLCVSALSRVQQLATNTANPEHVSVATNKSVNAVLIPPRNIKVKMAYVTHTGERLCNARPGKGSQMQTVALLLC